MKSPNVLFYAALSLAASQAQGQVVMSVVGDISPSQTVVSAVMTSDPLGTAVYLSSSSDPSILFSECGLTFNSSNYNIPQRITLRRKAFTPFQSLGLGGIHNIPTQSFNFILSEQNGHDIHTIPLEWKPTPAKIVSWWGDPHFTNVINDLKPNGQVAWDDHAIIGMPREKHYSILKSPKNDWEVIFRTALWGSWATVADRLCVRNGNNMICVNKNGTLTYLNPSSQDAFPLDVMKTSYGYQFLLPSGTAVLTNFGGHFQSIISVQPADFGGLVGIGNNTAINSVTSQDARRAWIQNYVVSNSVMESANRTENLSFSSSSGTRFSFSSCVEGSKKANNFKKVIVTQTTTHRETLTDLRTKTKSITSSVRVDSTKVNTQWETSTEALVVGEGKTVVNSITAVEKVTALETKKVTDTIVATSTEVVGTTSTITSGAYTTSINVINKVNVHTNNVTLTNNFDETLTKVEKSTNVVQQTVLTTLVENVKATKSVKGDDIIKTIENVVTDTIRRTNSLVATSTKRHQETKTILDTAVEDKTRTVVQTQETELVHHLTHTATDHEEERETKTHHFTDNVDVHVTESVTEVVQETDVHHHTSTHVIKTDVTIKSTKTIDVLKTVRETSTLVKKTTASHNAFSTNTVIEDAAVTVTDSVDQTVEVGHTRSFTSTNTIQEIVRDTKFITQTKVATSTVATDTTTTVVETSTVTFVSTINIDADLGKTISLPAEIAAARAVVWRTVYNPVQEYVTVNQTQATATVSNVNWVTVTKTAFVTDA